MFYTEHARMRITERNFSIDMIEDAMNLFSLHGKWDQKNELVTLHTGSSTVGVTQISPKHCPA